MSMSEIADLAGVRRPVVTTWRRRHPDFPQPVGGGDRPLFDAREVCGWLVATGRADRHRVEADLALHTLTRLAAALPAGELVATVTALICLRHLDGEPLVDGPYWEIEDLWERAAHVDPDDEMLCSEISALPDDLAWLPATVDDLVEAAWSCQAAFERIVAARDRLGARDLCAAAVAPELARLLARLVAVDRLAAPVVADPHAGTGDLLTAVVAAAGEHATPRVLAAETDPYLARLVRRRLAVHGVVEADQTVQISDGLHHTPVDDLVDEFGDGRPDPDVVVTQIPYRPQENRSPVDVLARVDTVTGQLSPGGIAAVLGPAEVLVGPLPRYSPAGRARATLLASGVVEAVIRLPAGLVPFRPLYETAVWVLSSAGSLRRRRQVLVADVSDRDLTAEVADALVADVVTWHRDGYRADAHTRVLCAQADVGALLDRQGPLTARPEPTAREFTTVAPATVVRVTELERDLDLLADPERTPRPRVRTGAARATAPRPAATTVGGLVTAQRLTVVPGTRLAAEHVASSGHHAVLGADEVAGRSRVGRRWVDRAVLAAHYPRAVLTQPGDVVVTTAPNPGVFHDRDGFRVVEFPARALRVRRSERDGLPPRVLAALLAAWRRHGWRGVGAGGGARGSRRLEDWPVPLLDPQTARRYDLVLADLDRRRTIALAEVDALDELDDLVAAGLADGTLTLQP